MNAYSIFNPAFANEIFDALDRNLSSFAAPSIASNKGTMPRCDIAETKDNYRLEMELPGLTEKDVTVNLKDRVLSVSTLKNEEKTEKEDKDDKDEQWLLKERKTISFTRRFSIPVDVDQSKIEASFKNGVLVINMAKQPEVQPKSIDIKIEG